ncbi:MAG: ribosome biogenesis GTP-binding protein YihA/YsxC [Ferruginibacter sp.]
MISSPEVQKCPLPDRPEFAFIGRSNVGKSSLINMLCGNEKLAKTSSSPGKTQLINHFGVQSLITIDQKDKSVDWYLVDLPGYGFAKVSQSSRRRWEQMIENYLRKRENLSMIFVLIDARHEPQKIDLAFLENIRKWQIPLALIFTKSDKENQRTVQKNARDFLQAMRTTWTFLPAHFITSAAKKTGKQKVLGYIGEITADVLAAEKH